MSLPSSHASYPGSIPPAAGREKPRLSSAQMVLLLVFATETILFGTLLSSYVYVRSTSTQLPYSRDNLAQMILPAANTLVLLVSAAAARGAEMAARAGRRVAMRAWLWAALLLGLVFVAGQVIEFTRAGMTPTGPSLMGMYFALIGFHAAHVIAGVTILALVLLRASLGDFTPRRHVAVTVGYWFWLYVTAVWLVLFIALYMI